jgi:predicted acylesterase/phospholipase RssA
MTRALIFAGGGQKVAYQAGVLQVWLDEARIEGAPIEFHHGDGASGGVLNLVQWCDGRSGTEIADRWRSLEPLRSVDLNWSELWRGPYAQSLFRLDRFHRNVLDHWAVDWDNVRTRLDRPATFNLFNFSTQQLEVVTNRDITPERIIAGISLPHWFPPVKIGEHTYIDAVYALDANLERAIDDGADELWIIWTVSRRGTWRRGSIADYFQSIEAASNSRFRAMLDRIRRSNEKIDRREQGVYKRKISCRILKAEVPIHYLFAFSADRIAEAVNLGVDRARGWCEERGYLPRQPRPPAAPGRVGRPVDVSFREQATGFLGYGALSPAAGETTGIEQKERISLDLAIRIPNVPRFVRDPAHTGEIRGTASITSLGDHDILDDSWYNVLILDPDDLDRLERRIIPYRLHLRSVRDGKDRTFDGGKTCDADLEHRRPHQKHGIRALWPQTTTFEFDLYEGWHPGELPAEPSARGRMYITLLDFLRQLTTYRGDANGLSTNVAAIARFQRMFVSHLWDVYAPGLLSSSPF